MRLRSSYDPQIFRLALPALGALAAEPLYLLADTAIVGHLGTRPLGGIAIAAIVLGCAIGATLLGTSAVFGATTGAPAMVSLRGLLGRRGWRNGCQRR